MQKLSVALIAIFSFAFGCEQGATSAEEALTDQAGQAEQAAEAEQAAVDKKAGCDCEGCAHKGEADCGEDCKGCEGCENCDCEGCPHKAKAEAECDKAGEDGEHCAKDAEAGAETADAKDVQEE